MAPAGEPIPGMEGTNPKDALGIKKSALRLVPPALVISVAPVMALGARKYGPYNWRETPVKLSVYLEAMLRHVMAVMDGENNDAESGEPHLAHVAASVGIVLDAAAIGKLVDDRPGFGSAAKLLDQQDSTIPRDGYIEVPEGRDARSMTASEIQRAGEEMNRGGQDSVLMTDYHFGDERDHDTVERHPSPNGVGPGVGSHYHKDGQYVSWPPPSSFRFQDFEGIGGSEL